MLVTIKKVKIHRLKFPVSENRYNVQVYTSVDGGKNFYYCGEGKFCKTKKEAKAFAREYKNQNRSKTTVFC